APSSSPTRAATTRAASRRRATACSGRPSSPRGRPTRSGTSSWPRPGRRLSRPSSAGRSSRTRAARPKRPVFRICAFSGKRGGFGAYVPLMRRIEDDPDLELLILLGDQHGSDEFGHTAEEARATFPYAELELVETGTGRGDSELVRAENLAACLAG